MAKSGPRHRAEVSWLGWALWSFGYLWTASGAESALVYAAWTAMIVGAALFGFGLDTRREFVGAIIWGAAMTGWIAAGGPNRGPTSLLAVGAICGAMMFLAGTTRPRGRRVFWAIPMAAIWGLLLTTAAALTGSLPWFLGLGFDGGSIRLTWILASLGSIAIGAFLREAGVSLSEAIQPDDCIA